MVAGATTIAVGAAPRGARADGADDLRAQFGLDHAKSASAPAPADDPLDEPPPAALATALPATYLIGLPVADSLAADVASYALGAARDEQGVGFLGANGLETRWTIDGAPADHPRWGGADTAVPLAFLGALHATAGGFAARDRASTGGAIDAALIEGGERHVLDARVYASDSLSPRARRLAPGIFQLRRLFGDPRADASASVVATGPLAPIARALGATRAWYAVGVAPRLARTSLRSETNALVDADGDQRADLNAAEDGFAYAHLGSARRTTAAWLVPVLARAGIAAGPHALALSIVGQYSRDERTLANATPAAAGVIRAGTTGDAIATYTGTWADTRARVQLAWHRSAITERARDAAAAGTPQLLSAYVPATLADDPALAAACTPATGFSPCPVPYGWFASGGPGLLVDQTADRPSATAELAHRFGRHVARIGGAVEDTRLVLASRYSGGELDRSLFDGHLDRARFHGTGTCVELQYEGPCDYTDTSTLVDRTRYTAAYVEDTFHPVPAIAVDAGLRYELMWVGTRLHFSDELAPRLGLGWRFLDRDGARGRAFAGLGRTFAYLPAGVGAVVLPGDRIVHDIQIANIGDTRSLDSGAPYSPAPGLAPTHQDEALAGFELAWDPAVTLTGWVRAARLVAMETTATALANPDDGRATAGRETRSFALALATTGRLALRAGYFYTLAVGSTTGVADPRQGVVLYGGRDFDTDLTTNLFGRLPTDLAHRFFVEARRTGHLAGIPVAFATRLAASSGRPRDVVSQSGEGVIYVLPRGDGGRNALVTQANVELAARVAGCDVTLDVTNLFDRTTATAVDGVYTIQGTQPISGGTRADLVFARANDGTPLQRWTPFQYGTSFQAPLAIALGIRRTF